MISRGPDDEGCYASDSNVADRGVAWKQEHIAQAVVQTTLNDATST